MYNNVADVRIAAATWLTQDETLYTRIFSYLY